MAKSTAQKTFIKPILQSLMGLIVCFAMCACASYEDSDILENSGNEEAWYDGAGFFYLDKLMFDKEGEESAFSTKKRKSQNLAR